MRGIRHLAEPIRRIFTAHSNRPSRSAISTLIAFFIALLFYDAVSLRKKWSYQQKTYSHEGLVLKFERALYRMVIVPLIAFLPAPLAYGIACIRGDWRYRLDTSKSERVKHSLESVFGEQLTPEQYIRITRDFFRIRSCEAVDVMRLAGNGRSLARLVEIRGLEHIEIALASNKGAILCGAHFGSFDCCFTLISMVGFPLTAIGRWTSQFDVKRSSIERFFIQIMAEKPMERHRRRANIQPHPGQIGAAVQAASVLRKNELLGILLDPPVLAADRKRAVPMEFLNKQALLLPGAATIAQLMDTPVLMTFLRRSHDWRHQILEISPPISMDGDVVTAFGRCLAVVDAAIRQDPAHWLFWDISALLELGLVEETSEV